MVPFQFNHFSGNGDERIPNWYYDSDKGDCTAFLYSGTGGNANRFATQEQCDRQCGIFRDQVIRGTVE